MTSKLSKYSMRTNTPNSNSIKHEIKKGLINQKTLVGNSLQLPWKQKRTSSYAIN